MQASPAPIRAGAPPPSDDAGKLLIAQPRVLAQPDLSRDDDPVQSCRGKLVIFQDFGAQCPGAAEELRWNPTGRISEGG
jgi:hypothetical protein